MKLTNLKDRVYYNAGRFPGWHVVELECGQYQLRTDGEVVLDTGDLEHLDKNMKLALQTITGNSFCANFMLIK